LYNFIFIVSDLILFWLKNKILFQKVNQLYFNTIYTFSITVCLILCRIVAIEKQGIEFKSSDIYSIDINFSIFILASSIKSKKSVINRNEFRQILRANTTALVQIVEELPKK
jgi:hypothetical protein